MKARRFSLTLRGEVAAESQIVLELRKWPQGRRQTRVRVLLQLGFRSLNAGHFAIGRFKPGESQVIASGRFFVHLQPRVPEDDAVLAAMEQVPAARRSSWLRELLLLGWSAEQAAPAPAKPTQFFGPAPAPCAPTASPVSAPAPADPSPSYGFAPVSATSATSPDESRPESSPDAPRGKLHGFMTLFT